MALMAKAANGGNQHSGESAIISGVITKAIKLMWREENKWRKRQ